MDQEFTPEYASEAMQNDVKAAAASNYLGWATENDYLLCHNVETINSHKPRALEGVCAYVHIFYIHYDLY